MFFPTFRYHPTLAPEGKKFTDEAEFAELGPEWVDTPAKLTASAPEPAPEAAPIKRFRRERP